MGITYNKEFQPKDRRIMPTGPRDRQMRQAIQMVGTDQSLLIEELRSQINRLQEQVDNKKSIIVEGYTAEQVDEEVIKAVKSETENLKLQHEQEKNHLRSIIDSKDEIIQHLKSNQSNNLVITEDKIATLILEATKNLSLNFESPTKDNRPKMETVFVDPTETNRDIENHIVIPEISPIEKEDINSKVNKLKGLLGKLPNKT